MGSLFKSSFFTLLQRYLFAFSLILLSLSKVVESVPECWKRKYYVNLFGVALNATVKCPMYFQWTVSDYCCYDKYDRFESKPYCCYSETYKLVIAVGFICLILLGSSCCIFLCWIYNLPHHVLYLLTCHKFNLNTWLMRNKNGPYVDPSFYSGEPFWARGAEMQPYPLRPMPPRIFYPAPPANMKFRWDMSHGQMPLFVLASRQFTRNPYSARPNDRQQTQQLPAFLSSALSSSNPNSRRSSTATLSDKDLHQNNSNKMVSSAYDFRFNIDEMEAAAELLEALKNMEEKGDKSFPSSGWNVADNLGLGVLPDYADGKPDDYRYQRPNTAIRNANLITDNSSFTSSCYQSLGLPVYNPPSVHINSNSQLRRHSFHHQGRSDSNSGVLNVSAVMESIPEDDQQEKDADDKETLSQSQQIQLHQPLQRLDSRITSALVKTTETSMTMVPFTPSLPGHIPESPEETELEITGSNRTLRRNSDAAN